MASPQKNKNNTYLDYNASAPLRDIAKRAMVEAMEQCGNPSSPHRLGRAARKLLEDARQTIADCLGVADEIIFTSGATEANHLALNRIDTESIIVSAAEHPSVADNAPGASIAPVDENGIPGLATLQTLLEASPSPTLVAAMSANNETGAITPNLGAIAALVHSHGGKFHCDITQSVGKCPLPPMVADTATLSAHKFGGPSGIGALISKGGGLRPQLLGGGQERGMRSGTQNVVAACGFAAALTDALKRPPTAELRDYFEAELRKLEPQAVIFAENGARLPNTSCFALPGLSGETMVLSLDLAGLAVGSGSACSSGKIEPSRVIKAMGYSDELAAGAVRVSLGESTHKEEIYCLLIAIDNAMMTCGRRRNRRKVTKTNKG